MKNAVRLIDAREAIRMSKEDKFMWVYDLTDLEEFLAGVPTADAELVKHGRWITHNKGQNNWVECSECNTVGSPFWKRCPMCEAKMEVDWNGI